MGYFKLLNRILPASPDAILKKATDAEAAVARMAHVNTIVNDLSDMAHYEIDFDGSYTLPVNSNKGIIDFINTDLIAGTLLPGFDGYVTITLTNPILNIANRDNVYLQITPYYAPNGDDNFVPYFIATGFLDGLNIRIYNANLVNVGADQCTGALYMYYEIKSLT